MTEVSPRRAARRADSRAARRGLPALLVRRLGARPRDGWRRDRTGSRPTRRWVGALGLLAVLLLAGGALLATVARPAQRTTAVLPVGASAPLVVLSSELLGAREGRVVVSARGDGPVLVARGSAEDVRAWTRGTAAAAATGLDDDGGVRVERTDGAATAPDPSGSDLWTAQQRGQGSAELDLAGGSGAGGLAPEAVLVASDGTAPAPAQVELTWSSRPVPLVAVVLLVVGAACAAAAGTAVVRAVLVVLRSRASAEAVP